MTRILGIMLALALAAAIVPQGSAPVEAAPKGGKKMAKKSGASPAGGKSRLLSTRKLVDVLITGAPRRKGLKSK